MVIFLQMSKADLSLSKAATPRGPVDEYSFLKSENDKPESASFLARLFFMIE